MQPSTPSHRPDTDPTLHHEGLNHNPETVTSMLAEAQQYVDDAYDQRLEQQTGVARAAIDQRGLHNSTPENVNPTPAEWVAMVGKAIEGIRRKEMDHTIMYGDTSITTSSAEKPTNDTYPLQDISRVNNQDELDLAA